MQSLSTCIPLESLLNILKGNNYSYCFGDSAVQKDRPVLSPAQMGTGKERVKVSVKKKKTYLDFVKIAWKLIDLQT